MNTKTTMLMILAGLALSVATTGRAEVRVSDLRCEYRQDPMGIDSAHPRLSWVIEAGENSRGVVQVAYQILVASSEESLRKDRGDLWDSGKVESDQSTQVAYSGKPLDSRTRCYWKVKAWTTSLERGGAVGSPAPTPWSQPAFWEMGLLQPTDWSAQWIDAVLKSGPTLKILKATYGDGSAVKDVTAQVAGLLKNNRLSVAVNNDSFGGDPARDRVKRLVVDYEAGGKRFSRTEAEGGTLRLVADAMSDPDQAVWLRKDFNLPEAPERATVSVNIAGYAELYINGKKVGSDVLTPAVSDHGKQVFYVTYDVCPLLHKGPNVIGLWLGRGWAQGTPLVRAQLDAKLPGGPFVLGTDASWKCKASPYCHIGGREWNNFGGERYDAQQDVPGWCKAGLDDSSWANAATVGAPGGAALAQQAPLNRIGKIIPAAAVTGSGPAGAARYVIDFGKDLTGWLRLKMPPLKPGAVVKMTFADVVRGDQYQDFHQVSEFVSAGKPGEVFENKFNYAGFRYVLVEGLPKAPAKEDATAMLVESALEPAGGFECSNDLLNRIHKLTRWTQRCLDLGGYYVDCPHRERMGYGDGQVAVEGFMTNFRADSFYRKWLWDWRLRQGGDGSLPHMAPFGGGGGGPGWPGLLAAITWRHYLYYGDRRVLEENYDAVRRYVDWIEAHCTDGILRKSGGQWDFLGDWVPPGRGMDTNNWPSPAAAELFNNCYRVYQMELLEKMAATLGRDDEVARCRARLAKIRPLIHAAFYDPAGKQYVVDEQAYYVMPLMTGVTPEALRPALLQKLQDNIFVKNKGHLDTGMFGTYFLMEYLRQIGHNDLVFTMFNQTTYPSWGYMLAQGATTCWEQWNGHWSRIHSCFTSADNWLYQGPGGIVADPAGPGFKKIVIRPTVVGDLAWVKCSYDSIHGRVTSNWRSEGGKLIMEIAVPANTTATVFVPAKDEAGVTESGKPAAKAEGVKFLRMENGAAVYEVGSGSYQFRSEK